MNLAQLEAEVDSLSADLVEGLKELRENSVDLANAEHAYRKAKSEAWVLVKDALPKATVPEKTAWVDAHCADLRLVRDMADLMRQVALEVVRSRRTQVSSKQSLLSAHTEEARFDRTAPRSAA